MLNIALPKGRLGDQVYELLASVGYDCKSIYDENRKLVFENPQTGVRYLLVKPSDVAIYVEHHAADVGIVGKDILMESNPDVYELLDLDLENAGCAWLEKRITSRTKTDRCAWQRNLRILRKSITRSWDAILTLLN